MVNTKWLREWYSDPLLTMFLNPNEAACETAEKELTHVSLPDGFRLFRAEVRGDHKEDKGLRGCECCERDECDELGRY